MTTTRPTDDHQNGALTSMLRLRQTAQRVAHQAYAPYSGLKVGAAGRTTRELCPSGCNVENSSIGLTLCAECGLISDLHRQGWDSLVEVSVVDVEGNVLLPCGRCRQLLFECGGSDLLVDTPDGQVPLGRLLPDAFGPSDLP